MGILHDIQVGSVRALSWKNIVMRRILATVPLSAVSESLQAEGHFEDSQTSQKEDAG